MCNNIKINLFDENYRRNNFYQGVFFGMKMRITVKMKLSLPPYAGGKDNFVLSVFAGYYPIINALKIGKAAVSLMM